MDFESTEARVQYNAYEPPGKNIKLYCLIFYSGFDSDEGKIIHVILIRLNTTNFKKCYADLKVINRHCKFFYMS